MLETVSKKNKIIAAVCSVVVIAAVVLFFLWPKDLKVKAGDTFVITVTADSVEDMYGYQFHINYDEDVFEYKGNLKSKVDDIKTIFKKEFDGYVLVGATMIGDQEGYSGRRVTVCEMAFEAKQDGNLSEMDFDMTDVAVVKADLEYIEDIEGWNFTATHYSGDIEPEKELFADLDI